MLNETIPQTQGLNDILIIVPAIFFLGILGWILGIVLFFKIWGMTRDVRKMKDMLQEWFDIEHPLVDAKEDKPKDQE